MGKLFDLVVWTVHSYQYGVDGKTDSDATLKIKIRGRLIKEADVGVGPVDALYNVLQKALRKFYPEIDEVTVVNFSSHIQNSQKGTEADVMVVIELKRGEQEYRAEAVSANIIEASWQALVEGISELLRKEATD